MYMKSNYFFIIFTTFCSFLITNITLAVQPGSYDHKNEIAYITAYDTGSLEVDFTKYNIIMEVDFKNKTVKNLARHKYIANLTINHDRTLLAYTDFDNIFIIRLDDGQRVTKLPHRGEALTWAEDRNYLAFFDSNNKYIGYYKVEDEVIGKAQFEGNDIYGILWDLNCNCFYYEVAENYLSPRKIFKINDGILKDVKHIKTISYSPDKKYYLNFIPSETSNSFTLSDYKNNTILFSSPVVGGIKNYELIWGEKTLRILGKQILIDYQSKSLLYPSYMATEGLNLKKSTRYIKYDMAADYTNYILIWNGKNFEVEDIDSGKIVKTYEIFW